jgi:protein-tyrosine phosphatase
VSRPFHVCLVCTGNTCRSPISAGILKQLVAEHNITDWEVTSAGTATMNGAPAAIQAIEAAREHGIDISDHHSRHFDSALARNCDLILVHSGEHLKAVAAWGEDAARKTFLLKNFPHAGDPGPQAWVLDPIGGDLDRYRRTYLELDESLRRIFPQLQERAEKGK